MAKQRKRTNKNVPAKGRLRDICDSLWGKSVLADWNHRCAICKGRATDPHHLVPRQHYATRYELSNGIGLCSRCHLWDPNYAPHQNAAGWLEWLDAHHVGLYEAYIADPRPEFTGTTNVAYFCELIPTFKQYICEHIYTNVVGVRFSAWLDEQGGCDGE